MIAGSECTIQYIITVYIWLGTELKMMTMMNNKLAGMQVRKICVIHIFLCFFLVFLSRLLDTFLMTPTDALAILPCELTFGDE